MQRPQTINESIQNYMTIAEGIFMKEGKSVSELPMEIQYEVCARVLDYAIPQSKNTEQVLDSEFVFEINVILQHFINKKIIRYPYKMQEIKLTKTCHTVGLHHVMCTDTRTDDYCVHEPH